MFFRFRNKHHLQIVEPSNVKLHEECSKKLNPVGTEFSFFDFSTKVSTFKHVKARLKNCCSRPSPLETRLAGLKRTTLAALAGLATNN